MKEACEKICQFIRIAEMQSLPLVFIHDITGFMVGKQYEGYG